MPLQCPKCKTMNRDTATFCDHCGYPLTAPAEQSSRVAPRPIDLPEEEMGTDVGAPQPSAVPRTDTPPAEAGSSSVRPAGEQARTKTVNAPKVKPGPPRSHVWRWYVAFVLLAAIGFPAFIELSDPGYFLHELLSMAAFFGGAASILGLPVALALRRSTTMGVVTNLREWYPHDQSKHKVLPNWIFDLRLTNRNWEPLRDGRGFLRPVVEVEFRADTLHGPPIEEGSRVVLRGRRKSGRFKVSKIWNVSPDIVRSTHAEQTHLWGRVNGLQVSQDQDMRYPGQKWLTVWRFRLQRTDQDFQELLRDEQGNPLPALPVEMRARVISGPLQEGDKVEVHGKRVQGTIYSREIYNHSAGGAALVVKEWAGVP